MKNISKEDFILLNTKTNKPIEDLDIVYHYTSVIELVNTRSIKLGENEEFVCVAELPLSLQVKISEAIELTK